MDANEVLTDLRERIDRGVLELDVLLDDARTGHAALEGKKRGLLVVRDWLRAYGPPPCEGYLHDDPCTCP